MLSWSWKEFALMFSQSSFQIRKGEKGKIRFSGRRRKGGKEGVDTCNFLKAFQMAEDWVTCPSFLWGQGTGQSRRQDFTLTWPLRSNYQELILDFPPWDGTVKNTHVAFLSSWEKGLLVEHLSVVSGHALRILEPLTLLFLSYCAFNSFPALHLHFFLHPTHCPVSFSWVMSMGEGRGDQRTQEDLSSQDHNLLLNKN